MKTEAVIWMTCLQAQECQGFPATPDAGRRHRTHSPREPPREDRHAGRNAGLRSQERIDFCHLLRLLRLCCFVITVLGRQHGEPRGRRGRNWRGEKLKGSYQRHFRKFPGSCQTTVLTFRGTQLGMGSPPCKEVFILGFSVPSSSF